MAFQRHKFHVAVDSEIRPGENPEIVAIRRLMLSLLEDAIRCYLRCRGAEHGQKARLAREVREWFLDDGKSESPFSFTNVCEALGVDAGNLRRGLTQGTIKREPHRSPVASSRAAMKGLVAV
jgi:hypothetical protein